MTQQASAAGGGVTSNNHATTGTGTSQHSVGTTKFANYAEYVAQIELASAIGSIPAIPNALATGQQAPAILVDPLEIKAYADSVADQLNGVHPNGPRFEDLSDRIADIILETSAQGASTLEIHLIDPMWIIPMSGFIQVDSTGYLWPPIDINFPSDTDCVWRLVAYAPTWGSMTEANLVLTFEDKIANQLRQMSAATGGVQQGSPNQSLGGFIKQLVDSTNNTLHSNIRLVEMISPKDPNYTTPITEIPKSAKGKLRTNPNKDKLGLSGVQEAQLTRLQRFFDQHIPTSGSINIAQTEASVSTAIQTNPGSAHTGYFPGVPGVGS